MNRGPHRGSQRRSVVHASNLQGSVVPEKQLERRELAAVRGPVDGVQTGPHPAGWAHAEPKQILGHADRTQKAGAGQCLGRLWRVCGKEALLMPRHDAWHRPLETS